MVYRSSLKVTLDSSAVKYKTFESLSIRVSSGNRLFRLIGLYRPPHAATVEFFNDFSDLRDSVNLHDNETIICGDFNCPGVTTSVIDTRLTAILDDHNFKQHITTSTPGSPAGNILDLVMSRIGGLTIHDVEVHDVGYSDHRVVFFSLNFMVARTCVESYTVRNLKFFDKDHFLALLTASPLFLNPPTTVDDYTNQFETDVLAALNATSPLVSRTKRTSYKL